MKRLISLRLACALVVLLGLSAAPLSAQLCTWQSGAGQITETCGNVGIGTSTPFRRLTVDGSLQLLGFPTGFYFGNGQQVYDNGGAGLVFNTAIANTKITIAPTGNLELLPQGRVGIGTTTPTEMLHVNGNALFTGSVTGGNIQAKYQDIAEWVPTTESLSAGTVVVLDPSVSNSVVASTRAYDTAVAGVISPQPGIVLGERTETSALVATTGRVRVRTRATRPIRIGDLLVTSDVAGTAMPSQPLDFAGTKFHRPGTIIGKALEPLESGERPILVLLSLQ